jgi:hypothetical protein
MKVRLIIFSAFVTTVFSVGCVSLPPKVQIGANVEKETPLSCFVGEPYLIDVIKNEMIMYSSLKQDNLYCYIKYRVDIDTGICNEIRREKGKVKYKNYFWDEVSETKESLLKKGLKLLAASITGSYSQDYGIQLAKIIDKKNSVRYIFHGKETTTHTGSGKNSSYDTLSQTNVGVLLKRGDNIHKMQPTDPPDMDVWSYPLAKGVEFPFLSKFYYLDKAKNTFIMSFVDGQIFVGDLRTISLRQRMLTEEVIPSTGKEEEIPKPFFDIAVCCSRIKGEKIERLRRTGEDVPCTYYWLVRRKISEKRYNYFLEKRPIDCIIP